VHSNGRLARPAGLPSLKQSRHSSRRLLCLLSRPPLHHSHSSPSLLRQVQLAHPWPHQALKVTCSPTDWSLAAHAEAVMDCWCLMCDFCTGQQDCFKLCQA